jgi:NAD(P)-dependent dehydrogenase (short-subunit alcohol dehydrogenase family)
LGSIEFPVAAISKIIGAKRAKGPAMYMKKLDLTGRNALVTGGGRGIGLACAEALAEAGARMVIADYDMAVAAEGQAALAAKGYRVDVVKMDVTKPDEVTKVADDLAGQGRTVEILVNNAGIARSMTPAETVADEHWLNVIDVNLNGVFWCCRAFGKHMLAQKKGSIVNIGSMSGVIVNKPQEQSYYNASKAGVHHLTKSLAAEWGTRGVRVNAVAPTYINTPLTAYAAENKAMFQTWLDMTPMGRMGEVDEIASTVHFLASDAASLLTGSIVLADGGYTCW